MKVCLVQIHTIPSVCNFRACFFHLTLEYMDFPGHPFFEGVVNNDLTDSRECLSLALMGLGGGWGEWTPKEHFTCGMCPAFSLVPGTVS